MDGLYLLMFTVSKINSEWFKMLIHLNIALVHLWHVNVDNILMKIAIFSKAKKKSL